METLSVLKKGARFVMACMLAGIMTAGLSPAPAWGVPDAAASGAEGGVAADVRAIESCGTRVLVRDFADRTRPTWHEPRALHEAFREVLATCRSHRR